MSTIRNSRRRLGRFAVAAIVSALAATAIPSANAVTAAADPEISAALQRIADQTGSIADCQLIHDRDPALSETVPCPWIVEGTDGTAAVNVQQLNYGIGTNGDYYNEDDMSMSSEETQQLIADWTGGDTSRSDLVEVPEVPEGGAASAPAMAPMAATGTWKLSKVTYTNYSYLGSVIYRYVHYANFKYSGGKVIAWGSRGDYLTNESSVVDIQERVSNTATRLPASTAYSYMKRKVALVAPVYGTYAINYPRVQIKMTGYGATSFTGSAY
ncbi:hypothetical protein [Streptomyces gardneri]|uniref:hypothetical protein n=1 Tax=Streptomyces gardneri TaxID=66892 RepID=UPI0036A3FA1E